MPSFLTWTCAAALAAAEPVTVLDFEDAAILNHVTARPDVGVSRTDAEATPGQHALRLDFPPFQPDGKWWPSAEVTLPADAGLITDWSAYRTVLVDVTNPANEESEIGLSFRSEGDGSDVIYFAVPAKATRTITVSTKSLVPALAPTPGPAPNFRGGEFGLRRVTAVSFWMRLQVKRPQTPTAFFIDRLRLVPKSVEDPEALTVELLQPHARGFFYETAPLTEVKARIAFDLPPAGEGTEGDGRGKRGGKGTEGEQGSRGAREQGGEEDESWRVGELVNTNPHPQSAIRNPQSAASVPYSATARLERFDGSVLAEKRLAVARPEHTVTFPLPPLQPDDLLYLRVSLREAAPPGRVLRREERVLRRLHRASTEVTFAPDQTLLINGQPFFPIGIYNAPEDDLGRLAEMGFNCAGPYITLTPEYAVAAERAGLRVLSSVPAGPDGLTAAAREISPFHHLLLGYYLFDEPQPGQESREEIQALCDQVTAADAYHPTLGCNNGHFAAYAGTSDVMMVDSYPAPGPLQPIVDRLDAAVRAMAGRGPVWFIPQVFGWQAYCDASRPMAKGRPPTFDEVRAMTWLGIVHGAQGIVYYSHRIQTFRVRCAYPATWHGLGYVTRELAALSGFLVAPPARHPATAYPPTVEMQARRRGDDWLLIAVNRTDEPATTRLTVPGLGDAPLTVLGEERVVNCAEGSFTDTFPPRTAHLYTTAALSLPPLRRGGGGGDEGESGGVTLAAVRAECEALDAPARARAEKNLALFDKGARLAASWGFPEGSRAQVWNRLIDGYRGTTWPLGGGGLAQTAFDPAKLAQGERWLEVRLPQPAEVARVVTLTAGLAFDVQIFHDGAWQTLPVASEETSPDYHESLPVRVAEYRCEPVPTDRVRLWITPDRAADVDEIIFEVEVYGPEPAATREVKREQ